MTNENEPPKESKPMFNRLGKVLVKFSIKEQLEMSMIATIGMFVLTTISLVYMAFFVTMSMWFKVLLVINGLFGLLFIFSMVASTYAQYKAYLGAMEAQDILKGLTDMMAIDSQQLKGDA
jgi:hypothetical protein